jgi:hypothetical protein
MRQFSLDWKTPHISKTSIFMNVFLNYGVWLGLPMTNKNIQKGTPFN